jgi:hypothetical protein
MCRVNFIVTGEDLFKTHLCADGNRFRVGVDNEQNLQDPLEFNIDPIQEHDEKNR